MSSLNSLKHAHVLYTNICLFTHIHGRIYLFISVYLAVCLSIYVYLYSSVCLSNNQTSRLSIYQHFKVLYQFVLEKLSRLTLIQSLSQVTSGLGSPATSHSMITRSPSSASMARGFRTNMGSLLSLQRGGRGGQQQHKGAWELSVSDESGLVKGDTEILHKLYSLLLHVC